MAEGKKWLAYGCFGCLGIVGLFLVLGALVFGTAYLGVQGEEVADRVLTHPLPPVTGPDDSVLEKEPAAGDPVDPSSTALPGRVTLVLADAEFEIEPGRSGEPIRVEAKFDEKTYDLQETYAEVEGGWTYDLRFHRTGSGVLSILKMMLGGQAPRVRVVLPPDVPIVLDLRLEKGGASIEVGGLWLTEADFDFKMGGAMLSVGEPLRAPMDRMTIHGSMGGGAFMTLGNASPRKLDVDFSMGGMDLDLEGLWLQDSDISISHSMGGGSVRLPSDVNIVGVPSRERMRAPADPETKLPTLTFTVTSSQGELDFH